MINASRLSRNKMSINGDKLTLDNSIGIFPTETWLDENISDTEIQIKNYNCFRSDRIGQSRGGTTIYLGTELSCKVITTFSNSGVEVWVVNQKY